MLVNVREALERAQFVMLDGAGSALLGHLVALEVMPRLSRPVPSIPALDVAVFTRLRRVLRDTRCPLAVVPLSGAPVRSEGVTSVDRIAGSLPAMPTLPNDRPALRTRSP